jgi:UDP-N-acetylglucosamine 2-epimerase (non-hydrolysing)
MISAAMALTHIGGIREETTYQGVPCLTARPSTERLITIKARPNRLVDSACEAIVSAALDVVSSERAPVPNLVFWDGSAAKRIVNIMLRWERNGASDPVERGVLGTTV